MKHTIRILLVLFFVTISSYSQIKGKIVNEKNEPLSEVNVLLNGRMKGAETNSEGVFEIKNVKGNRTLTISHLGYDKKVLKVQAPINSLMITLESKNTPLDEVVVDGQLNKRRTPSSSLRLKTTISKLPQNIQIVTDELLETQMITNMLDGPFKNVSGVSNIEHWGHFARINMRGFRLPAFRNGVNTQDKWGPLSEDMFMVDKIEFVKGPSGFMMAAGEPGGFYNVVTKKPTKHKIGKVSVLVGTQDTYRGAFDFGGKIGNNERFLYRLNTMYESRGTHLKHQEPGTRFGVVPALSCQITPKTKFLTEFSYQKVKTYIGSAYVFNTPDKGYGSLDRNFSMVDSKYPRTNINETSLLNQLTHDFNDNWSAELKYISMNYDQEGISTWTWALDDTGNADRRVSKWDAISEGNYFQAYINGNFNTGGLQHKVLVGYDFTDKKYWAHDFYTPIIVDTTKPFNVNAPHYGDFQFPAVNREPGSIKDIDGVYNYGSKINSAYAQDELSFLEDRIRLTIAGRYTKLADKPYNKEEPVNYEKFTPRIGLSADILPQLTVYGLYDQSFLPASGAKRDGSNLVPIEGTIYEGGLKSSLLDDRVTASLSVYNITKNNITVTDPTSNEFVVQLGELQSKGFEFDLQGKITEELNLILNYANTNVEITKDTDPNVVGNRIAGHAKHITNGWLSYDFNKNSSLKGFRVSLGYQYQVDRSSWAWGAENETDLPDYFRMDGAINWQNDKWRVGLNINNILDEYLYSGANYGSYLYWQSEPGINGRISISYNL
ncbi:MAG: TonB-dependent siderophore receptor [Maribacter sp.]|nr:MAG: TonB-dependent siderophore receptor [Maribacter sp.]